MIPIAPGLDPRCYSNVPLKPPKPLPHVSRRALKRVKHRIKPPEVCDVCGWFNVDLVNNIEIYGRSLGEWPYAYYCRTCKAYVTIHPHTDLPTGIMAETFTRDARAAAKIPFQCLVRKQFGNERGKAYWWLSIVAKIPLETCHFSMMDEDTAIRVLHICYDELFN